MIHQLKNISKNAVHKFKINFIVAKNNDTVVQ